MLRFDLFLNSLNRAFCVTCRVMTERSRKIRYFLFGQHLADGVRVTVSIILPAVVGALTGYFESGVTMSLGALCVSISDAPGPANHKRNGMALCLGFLVVMSLLTGMLNHYPVWLGVLIAVSTFFFSMFNVFGSRAASVGTAVLLLMVLRMSDLNPVKNVLSDTLYILAGGAWYMLFAMLFMIIRPFRPIQRALGDCITETAGYLRVKADFYDLTKDTADTYSQLITRQAAVNERQDEVRAMLFRNRSVLRESTYEGRLLVFTFATSVDLFEQIMAVWYDYDELRKRYGNNDILNKVQGVIKKLADKLERIGEAIHSQTEYKPQYDIIEELNKIKKETEAVRQKPLDFTLRKILVNIRNQYERVALIGRYFSARRRRLHTDVGRKDYSRFVPHQAIAASVFINNLTMESSAFRHSLRVMLTCTVGYILSATFLSGNHSYWILMTIIIIMKPAYSLTKSKNTDRLSGTIGGAILGLLLLHFVKSDHVLFGLLVFFALGAYTFVRVRYVVMVIFLTPYVLILFHFLGENIVNVAGERLFDTLFAGLLSFLSVRFLFPRWESDAIKSSLAKVLQANMQYLKKLREIVLTGGMNSVTYKLVRKEVFVSTANLAAALHRMQSEPRSKQQFKNEIYELVVLNHVLSSNIAGLTDSISAEHSAISRKSLSKLDRSIENISMVNQAPAEEVPVITGTIPHRRESAIVDVDETLEDRFDFIEKITADIRRIGEKIEGRRSL